MPPDHALQVALPVPLPRLFDYLPPIGQAASPGDVGKRVSVMFGNRALTGFVAGVGPPADPGLDLRPADALLDAAPLLHDDLHRRIRGVLHERHRLGQAAGDEVSAQLRGSRRRDRQREAKREHEAGHVDLQTPGLRSILP